MLLFTLLLSFVLTSFTSCNATNASGRNELTSIAESELDRDYLITFNTSETFALCIEKPQDDHAGKKYKYVVVDLTHHTILNKGVYQYGYVKWADNESLEIYSLKNFASDKAKSDKVIVTVNNRKQ